MIQFGPGAVRRTLLVGGTARYDHHPELPQVRTDMDVVSNVFALLGYETGHQLLDKTCEGFRSGLSGWAGAEDRTDDALVLYYSGHGDRDHQRHYLLCRDSRSDRLAGTALASEDVVRIISESGIRRLLLIIDTCYAGQGSVDAARVLARDLGVRLSTTRAADEHRLTAFSVIAATRSHELAEDGAFTYALRTAISDPDLGGHRQPKLYLEQVVDRVNEVLAEHSPYQHAALGTLPTGEGFSFIPNPRYTPDVPDEGIDLAEQRTWVSSEGRRRREELITHFEPRGRGTDAYAGITGSYFTGRLAALTELTDWLDNRSRQLGRCSLVTGRGGVGKSSLLGRLILLADPLLRATLPDIDDSTTPPRQRVHAALHARHKLLEDITAGIADAAGLAETDPERLIAALAGRTEPLVIVIDALDEAGTATGDAEPHRIAAALLSPLSQLPCVRLLVGARPHMRDALGRAFTCLDLDEPRWTGERDIEEYAHRLLLAPDGPGSVGVYTAATAKPVACAISSRANRNYLVARLIARPLAYRARPVDTSVPGWEEELPRLSALPNGSAGPAFRWALHEQLQAREVRGRALLTALAHAEGSGLPAGDIWRATASAFTGDEVTGQDIRWILDSASAHIVEDQDVGPDGQARSVYRLYHESYAEELRAAIGPDAGERIAAALLATVSSVPGTQSYAWSHADPYVRAHLASHAAGHALLDDLVLDPAYLLVAEPSALHRALRHVRNAEAQTARAAYERCSPVLADDAATSPAAQLRLAALQSGADALAEAVRLRFSDLPWDTLWAEVPRRPFPFRAIGSFTTPLRGAEVLDVSGTKVLATAQASGRLELWDFDTGVHLGQLPPPASSRVLALVSCAETRAPWLLVHSGHSNEWESSVEVFDVRTRHRLGLPVKTKAAQCALAEVGGTCVIGLMATDGTVQLIDTSTGSVLARLTSRMRTSNLARRPRDSATALVSGLRHPQHLAMGVHDGQLVVAAAVGVGRTTPRLSGRAELATWTVDPGQGWRVLDERHYRLRGRNVAAMAVRRGRILVSSEGRPRITGRAQVVIRRGNLTEWFYRRGMGPSALVMTDDDSYRVWAKSSFVSVTNTAGKETNWLGTELSASAQVTVIPSDSMHADLLTWRTEGSSVHIRALPLEMEEGPRERRSDAVDARHAHLVTGEISGKPALVRCDSTKPPCLVDPASGQVISVFECGLLEEIRLQDMAYCGAPGTPVVAYRWLRQWRALHWVRVYDGNSSRSVRLGGGFLRPVIEMQITSFDGLPLLIGLSSNKLTAWNLRGVSEGQVDVSRCLTLRALALEGSTLLSVVDIKERAIRIFRLPDFDQLTRFQFSSTDHPGVPLAANPYDWSYTHDLALWNGSPVAGWVDQAGWINVHSILDDSLEWSWKLPQTQQVTHLTLTTVEKRGAAIVCTTDGTILLVEAGSEHLLCQVHLGVAIQRITVISEGVVGLITDGGLFCLRLTSNSSTTDQQQAAGASP
ncbi:caspase family protein [Streptomyces sp. MB22_4]|uniref:caspase family protein n=1 Tax=Streptomyces sp. MB22_4 TaxID=3383120 RepID=UPI0039A1AF05